ncbi:uncharacterized protein [Mytilus edulis]|uniref:uncharacterized protein n=1 Tax=Mytilus edulis TaxID=6550 RepID=UPI0039EF3CF4
MCGIKSFGEVQIDAKSCEIVLLKKKVKQAQMLVPRVRSRSIENIKLTIHKTINTQEEAIYGCSLLVDGRMAFTYYYEWTVKIFNSKGLKYFEVKMSCIAFDILYISEDNTLAVSSGNSKKQCITIIDVERKQIKKIIPVDSFVYGIALNGNRLIYSAYTNGIRMINLNDESIHDIVGDKMPSECYTVTYMDKIYHTNRVSDTVSCFTLEGKLQWTFQNENVLKYTHVIDVDNDGNLYVVGNDSNNMVIITPDGKRLREVLTASDGLNRPTSVHYNKQKKQLLVANFRNEAQLFSFN